MSTAPGQSTVPFEEFIAEARLSLGSSDLHFTAVELSGHRVRVHSGMGDKEFSSRAEAHTYMDDQRKTWGEKFGNFYRIVEVPHEQPTVKAKPVPHPSQVKNHARKEEAHPEARALQKSPPKTDTANAGPAPAKASEPGPAQRSVATEPLVPAAKSKPTRDSRPAAASPSDRAKATSLKSSSERPLALASDAGVEQLMADTIGSVPALVGMAGVATMNPIALYQASQMADRLRPLQQSLEDDAAERFHRAEGTAPDSVLGVVAFGAMVIPQMIGGPEEEGALAAREIGQVQTRIVKISLARLSRFAEAAETGQLRSVVTDERLFSKLQTALTRARKAGDKWASFRARAGNQLSELYKTALHHFKYTRSRYRGEILNLDQLWVAGGSSHAKLHAAEGLPGLKEIPGKGMLPKAYFGMDTQVEIASDELQNMLRFWTAKEKANVPTEALDEIMTRFDADFPGSARDVSLPSPAEARAIAQPGVPLSVQLQEELSWAQFEEYLNLQEFGRWNPEEWVGSFSRDYAKPRANL
jgi:hypothetical protein